MTLERKTRVNIIRNRTNKASFPKDKLSRTILFGFLCVYAFYMNTFVVLCFLHELFWHMNSWFLLKNVYWTLQRTIFSCSQQRSYLSPSFNFNRWIHNWTTVLLHIMRMKSARKFFNCVIEIWYNLIALWHANVITIWRKIHK